jgi:hypothetical protein
MRFFQVFDIVTTQYYSLNGNPKTGIFLVLDVSKGNLLCAKLTSQYDVRFLQHSVLLLQRTNPFLECDSYIQLDKLNTLNVKNCSYLGRVAPVVRKQIKDGFNKFANDVLYNLYLNLGIPYISPNVK